MICPRCGEKPFATTMSYFNTEEICVECKTEERTLPGYKAAVDAEAAAMKMGNYNFKGVGLSAKDHEVLARLRAERKKSGTT